MKNFLKKRKRIVLLSMSVIAKLLVTSFILIACSESVTTSPATPAVITPGLPIVITRIPNVTDAPTVLFTKTAAATAVPNVTNFANTAVPAPTPSDIPGESGRTTPPVAAKNPVLADYPNAKPVDINGRSVPKIVAPRGYYPLLEPTFKVLVVVDEPLKVYNFYKQNYKQQGFQSGSDIKSTDQSFSYLFYSTGSYDYDVVAIVIGPFDAFNLADVIKDAPELAGKIKLGDTLIVLASGTN